MRYTIISFIKVRTSSYLLIGNQVFKLLVVTAFFVFHLHAYLCLMHAMTSSRHNNRPSNSVNSKLVIVVFTNHSVEAPVHEPNWIRGCVSSNVSLFPHREALLIGTTSVTKTTTYLFLGRERQEFDGGHVTSVRARTSSVAIVLSS